MKHYTRAALIWAPLAFLGLVFAATPVAIKQANAELVDGAAAIPIGKHSFEFSDWGGPAINVHTYKPEIANKNSQILFIMHGNSRDPERYVDNWVKQSDEYGFLLVAPEFSRKDFSSSRNYNLGNVYRKNGRNNYGRIKEDRWTFSTIEPLFDEIKRRTGSEAETYNIFGHSAGGQFVHRFVYFKPTARYEVAIAANAGWYTLPSILAKWPYGLGDTFLDEDDLKMALGKNLVILLGTADTDIKSSSLRKTDEANAQGPHRFARGKTFFDVGRRTAKIYDIPFRWRIYAAPDVAHSNENIAPFAAPLVAGDTP